MPAAAATSLPAGGIRTPRFAIRAAASESLRHSAEEHSGGRASGRAASLLRSSLSDWLSGDFDPRRFVVVGALSLQFGSHFLWGTDSVAFKVRVPALLPLRPTSLSLVGNNVEAAGASRPQWPTSRLPHLAASSRCRELSVLLWFLPETSHLLQPPSPPCFNARWPPETRLFYFIYLKFEFALGVFLLHFLDPIL